MLDYTYVNDGATGAELYFGSARVVWDLRLLPDGLPPAYTQQDYQALLSSLLPVGPAWPREAGSVLQLLLYALAAEFERLELRMLDLVGESDPRLTVELLPDWERVAGLPDPCVGAGQTLELRRAALTAKLTNVGGQSRAFYLEVAARLGYSITIDEFFTEAEAIAAGIPYTGTSWAHTWRINAAEETVREFRVGGSVAGERLRSWGNEMLECVMNRLKPAHTILLFAYS
ncbi:MAG: DUF2313 domain-containing protein [Piscinibacter sp.]|uniref:YmfQ family protein n=1 Tax=Piscinibacter sp. TaxID=1903157 RepID=UPI0025907A29|nr:putative phage tail protein [Piscinibacter sp.]MCW5666465.1 DUF2313 domain-containing protein [Piscinibacter sp.]